MTHVIFIVKNDRAGMRRGYNILHAFHNFFHIIRQIVIRTEETDDTLPSFLYHFDED